MTSHVLTLLLVIYLMVRFTSLPTIRWEKYIEYANCPPWYTYTQLEEKKKILLDLSMLPLVGYCPSWPCVSLKNMFTVLLVLMVLCTSVKVPNHRECIYCLSALYNTKSASSLPPFADVKRQALAVLAGADVATLSVKQLVAGLSSHFGVDLKPMKGEIKAVALDVCAGKAE